MRSEQGSLQLLCDLIMVQSLTQALSPTVMRYWLLFLGTLLLSTGARAQRCGGGDAVIIRLVSTNDRPVEGLRYELMRMDESITYNSLQTLLSPQEAQSYYRDSENVGIGTSTISRLLPLLRHPQQFSMPDSVHQRQEVPLPGKGKVLNGRLVFYAKGQLAWEPCLLKLFDGKTEFYLVCNPFGGCRRTATIRWDKKPRLVATQSY